MNKDVLYAMVESATVANDRAIVSKAIEEMQELRAECDRAIESLQEHGTIENFREIVDEMADAICVTEQITGERDMIFIVHDRLIFKLNRLAYRLKNGGLFK